MLQHVIKWCLVLVGVAFLAGFVLMGVRLLMFI